MTGDTVIDPVAVQASARQLVPDCPVRRMPVSAMILGQRSLRIVLWENDWGRTLVMGAASRWARPLVRGVAGVKSDSRYRLPLVREARPLEPGGGHRGDDPHDDPHQHRRWIPADLQ
jgi:hypothetical protein